jgi:hypothetical protein
MKRILSAALLLLVFSTASFSGEFIASGRTYSALGDYTIEAADSPVFINGEKLKAYTISYENSPLEVTVIINNDKKGLYYLALSANVSVKYVNNGDFFGIQKIDNTVTLGKTDYITSVDAINMSEYFHQKVIARGDLSEFDSIGLIAAYFPLLIKSESVANS